LLRVNAAAQITDVCEDSLPIGCLASNYGINGVILGTLSTKLTLNAALDPTLDTHTFVAIMANTIDNSYSSSLLFGNFKTLNVAQENIATFSLGIQIEEEVAVIVDIREPIPDPVQQSSIASTNLSSPDANKNVTIKVNGVFVEDIRSIEVNGRRIAQDAWAQNATTITLTVPSVSSGSYVVQIYNGSAPILEPQTVVVTNK
jgi:hypothetical protein